MPARADWPRITTLVCDDAAAFRLVTEDIALCWVHEGRQYTKLVAYLDIHRQMLDTVRDQFWTYYRELRAYREHPTADERTRLTARFEALFGQVTGSRLLDERLAKTRDKQASLLRVLEHPELPLHNNPA
ncbi:MAG: transposase, partial [Chloroflexota bacterium]